MLFLSLSRQVQRRNGEADSASSCEASSTDRRFSLWRCAAMSAVSVSAQSLQLTVCLCRCVLHSLPSLLIMDTLLVVQLLNNFPAFHGTRLFITVFTRALDRSLLFLQDPPQCYIRLANREYGHRDLSRWPRDTLYPQKLALISTTITDSGHGIAIVM
jgi:hypothetical protein